ncbi:MAG TPA: hypothetical protein VF578_01035 [Methylomirabilota bacterium]
MSLGPGATFFSVAVTRIVNPREAIGYNLVLLSAAAGILYPVAASSLADRGGPGHGPAIGIGGQ